MKQKWISNLLQYFLYLRFRDIIKRRVATAIPMRDKVKHTRRKTMTNTSTVAQRDGEKHRFHLLATTKFIKLYDVTSQHHGEDFWRLLWGTTLYTIYKYYNNTNTIKIVLYLAIFTEEIFENHSGFFLSDNQTELSHF